MNTTTITREFDRDAFADYLMQCIECEYEVNVDMLTQEELAFYLEFMGYAEDNSNWLLEMDEEIDYSNIQEPVTVDFAVEEENIFDDGNNPF